MFSLKSMPVTPWLPKIPARHRCASALPAVATVAAIQPRPRKRVSKLTPDSLDSRGKRPGALPRRKGRPHLGRCGVAECPRDEASVWALGLPSSPAAPHRRGPGGGISRGLVFQGGASSSSSCRAAWRSSTASCRAKALPKPTGAAHIPSLWTPRVLALGILN